MLTGLLLKLYRERRKKAADLKAKLCVFHQDIARPSVSDSEVKDRFSISTINKIQETFQENKSQTDLDGSDYFLNSLEEVLDFAP